MFIKQRNMKAKKKKSNNKPAIDFNLDVGLDCEWRTTLKDKTSEDKKNDN